MLTPLLPKVVSSWLDVPFVVDYCWYTRETEHEKPSSVAVLDTNLLPYPVQRHLKGNVNLALPRHIVISILTLRFYHKHHNYPNHKLELAHFNFNGRIGKFRLPVFWLPIPFLCIGVSEGSLAWFANYLSQRVQCIKSEHLLSQPLPVTMGVSQGSILGPTLFSIYINNIAQAVGSSLVHLYADDTVYTQLDPPWILC
jgi:hypothetical protein